MLVKNHIRIDNEETWKAKKGRKPEGKVACPPFGPLWYNDLMSTAIFDTLQYAKRLREAGVPEKQAEVQAEALREIEQSRFDELATKADIARLEGEIKLLKWMLGIVIAGIASLIAGIATLILKTFLA